MSSIYTKAAFVSAALLFAGPSFAVSLPDGTCSGSGADVVVKSGKIVQYSFRGKPYAVRVIGPDSYKIGPAGALRVRNATKDRFKATFYLSGRESSMNFRCN